MKALDSIKILDFSQGAAGPYASMLLGDFGADIIKVEPPQGDWGRTLGPPFIQGESATFLSLNRNKRSLVLDLKKQEAKNVIKKLVAEVDVVIESFRPGVMERLGLGYEELSTINSKLIYCSISGFGQKGPWKDKPGVDGVIQAISGFMSVTGFEDLPPVKGGTIVADISAGTFASHAIMMALFAREKYKIGQKIEQSLFDSMLAIQSVGLAMYFAGNELPKRLGSEAPYAVPNGTFQTKDGYIMLAANLPKKWEKFCELVNHPEWQTDPRFVTNERRVKNRKQLIPLIQEIINKESTNHWLDVLEEYDIICSPIATYQDIENFEQVKVNDMIVTSNHPKAGEYKIVGIPQKLTGTPGEIRIDAPMLGQHSIDILEEYKIEKSIIEELFNGVMSKGGIK